MKNLSYFSHYRLLIIALGVLLLLTSCEQFGLFNNPPSAEEIQSPGGFDPGMELSSKFLICPVIPETNPILPPAPYDEELGDCALIGKSEEIETWLTAMEQIAANCLANREPNWSDTLAVRSTLDIKVDEMEVSQSEPTVTPYSELLADGLEMADPMCPLYNNTVEGNSESGDVPPDTHHYTEWLKRIAERVEKYCLMTDELVKPLWQACDQINFYQDCQEPNHQMYHAIINASMNAANVNYEYTDFFYTNTLQEYGWGNFRLYFNETSIYCPLDSQAPDTKFTFSQNAFCRKGPSSEYEKVATFLEGQEVQIEGRNHHEPRWWLVPNPGARGYCWVSDSTGSAEGPLEELEIVAPPPLVINPEPKTCSKDLEETACAAVGGTWTDKDKPSPYCTCP